ncbi:hypothetical protein GB928_007155 [Shinella curvata]|uniref:Uncharacterized protein n=1 Tax=Shinella curvata TaxID=1817964 RepID=A0ABT8XB45_9HYPH|nr:hypothetical protein [Shinella curvata]MCJ8054649.1 hypothetical protein [Shinella curvata]MDO6120956.1 hypothetical protein [Shinella curvata]
MRPLQGVGAAFQSDREAQAGGEMHVLSLLSTAMFKVDIDGVSASISDLFPDWTTLDRFGVVIDEPFGGIGASHLIQSAMMAYYDAKPSRRTSLTVYPEVYAFHVGKGYGAHAPYDFWPARREVILKTSDPREVLDAINDRGITRIAIPDRPQRDVIHRPKEAEAALDRIASAYVYGAGGRVQNPDVWIEGVDRRTEYNAMQTLRPLRKDKVSKPASTANRPIKEADDDYQKWLVERDADVTSAQRAASSATRNALLQNGLARESYRRVGIKEAIRRLASAGLTG